HGVVYHHFGKPRTYISPHCAYKRFLFKKQGANCTLWILIYQAQNRILFKLFSNSGKNKSQARKIKLICIRFVNATLN
ncbi:MAG: hypothetical protein ACI9DQ_000585, partial [Glaciecola sp.]